MRSNVLPMHDRSAAAEPPPPPPQHAPAEQALSVEAAVEARFRRLCTDLDASVDSAELAAKVCAGLPDGVTEEQLSDLMAETAAYQGSMHPDFGRLAARVAVEVLHERTSAELLPVLRAMRQRHCRLDKGTF